MQFTAPHMWPLDLLPSPPFQRELYALLNFMYPDLFTDPTLFDSAFNLTRNMVDDSRLAQAHYVGVEEGGGGGGGVQEGGGGGDMVDDSRLAQAHFVGVDERGGRCTWGRGGGRATWWMTRAWPRRRHYFW